MTFFCEESTSSVKALLTLFIDGKEISKEDIYLSLDDVCCMEDTSMKIDELCLLSVYCFISGFEDTSKVKEALDQVHLLKQESLTDEITYQKLCLSKALLNMPIEERNKKETFAHIKYLTRLDDIALLGVVTFLTGIFRQKESFIIEGVKISELLISLINDSGEMDAFFLLDKGVYKKDSLRASIFILMSLYGSLVDSQRCNDLLPKLDPYEGGLFQTLDIEQRLLCRLLEKALSCRNNEAKIKETPQEVEGLLNLQSDGFSFKSSLYHKVGIGSLSHLDKLVIPSFGPHVLPLGKSDLYGLKQPLALNGDVTDEGLSMWSRVASTEEYGLHWIHSLIKCQDNICKIESFVWSAKAEEGLSLVFFLRGKSIKVLDKVYNSGGLERAYVETSKIDLDVDGRNMQILLKAPLQVEIIPLAGQEFFWNSDFIVSFPFFKSNVLSIDFVMD
ncbi:MAG: hypothetical protein S4CHLAM20_00830 [Chlamydiia bacterium]|nr:hypothetical protein [Chlamydiia bacterium]